MSNNSKLKEQIKEQHDLIIMEDSPPTPMSALKFFLIAFAFAIVFLTMGILSNFGIAKNIRFAVFAILTPLLVAAVWSLCDK